MPEQAVEFWFLMLAYEIQQIVEIRFLGKYPPPFSAFTFFFLLSPLTIYPLTAEIINNHTTKLGALNGFPKKTKQIAFTKQTL